MSTIEIREELHEIINKADERLLNVIYAMIQADMSEVDYQLNDAHKKVLDERIASHSADSSSGSNWEETKSRIQGSI